MANPDHRGGEAMLKDFKEFAMRGNVLDMAVGIVLGVAFGRIVTSLVNDLLMPPIGLLVGRVNFNDLFLSLNGKTYPSVAAAKAAGAATINYGAFINTIIEFIIVAFAMFLIVRWMIKLLPPPTPAAAPATKECTYCASTIPAKATRCPNCTSQVG